MISCDRPKPNAVIVSVPVETHGRFHFLCHSCDSLWYLLTCLCLKLHGIPDARCQRDILQMPSLPFQSNSNQKKKRWWERHGKEQRIYKNSSPSYESDSSAFLWKPTLFFLCCFFCLFSLLPPPPAIPPQPQYKPVYPSEESKMFWSLIFRFQQKWYGACDEKRTLKHREMFPPLSLSLPRCCIYDICYKIQSWWMIDETLTSETENLIRTGATRTNIGKTKAK